MELALAVVGAVNGFTFCQFRQVDNRACSSNGFSGPADEGNVAHFPDVRIAAPRIDQFSVIGVVLVEQSLGYAPRSAQMLCVDAGE